MIVVHVYITIAIPLTVCDNQFLATQDMIQKRLHLKRAQVHEVLSSVFTLTYNIKQSTRCFITNANIGNTYSRTSIKRPPSIKRPLSKVPNYYFVSKVLYSIPLFNGQPLLSGQFSKSPDWPLTRGPTVLYSRHHAFAYMGNTYRENDYIEGRGGAILFLNNKIEIFYQNSRETSPAQPP